MLVFAAADEDALQNLKEETSRYLAWESIQRDSDSLNLDQNQRRQVKDSVEKGDQSIQTQLDAAYQWALAPTQEGTKPLDWDAVTLRGADLGSSGNLVQRASYRLQGQELLVLNWSPIHLKRELDQYIWKDGHPHVTIRQLWEYLATYTYFPRLKDRNVLLETIRAGVISRDFFGYANGVSDEGYAGLVFGRPSPGIYYDDSSVVIRPVVAEEYIRKANDTQQVVEPVPKVGSGKGKGVKESDGGYVDDAGEKPLAPTRFYGTVHLSPLRITGEAGTIHQEVIQHLEALLGSQVEVTLEITATASEGFPDNVVRTVTENARTLKFDNFGFEED
jgi:hypothetical protein